MSTTKVLFLITKGNWGGAQRYVYDLATALPTAKFAPQVLCGAGHEFPQRLSAAGIPVITWPELGRNIRVLTELKIFWRLLKFLAHERPQIVHLNSSKIAGLGALAARISRWRQHLTGVKIIFTVHGWPFREARVWPARLLIWLASWLTALLADRVIVITQSDARAGRWLPFCRHKIRLIPNGLAPGEYLPAPEARAALARRVSDLHTDQGTLWLGAIAELTANKNLSLLINALAKLDPGLPPWQAVIIGEGEERETLNRLITDYQLNNHIFLTGFVPEAARYLKALDLFILTSQKEGLPYVILEAAQAERPIIATRVGGLPDLFPTAQFDYLIKSNDAPALTKAIEHLLKHPAERARLAKSLKAHNQPFSRQTMVQKTISLYNEGDEP